MATVHWTVPHVRGRGCWCRFDAAMGAARQYGAGDAGSAFDGSARVSADMSQVWSGRPFVGALAEDDRVQIPITQLLGPGYSGGLGDGNLYVGDTEWHPVRSPLPRPSDSSGRGICRSGQGHRGVLPHADAPRAPARTDDHLSCCPAGPGLGSLDPGWAQRSGTAGRSQAGEVRPLPALHQSRAVPGPRRPGQRRH